MIGNLTKKMWDIYKFLKDADDFTIMKKTSDGNVSTFNANDGTDGTCTKFNSDVVESYNTFHSKDGSDFIIIKDNGKFPPTFETVKSDTDIDFIKKGRDVLREYLINTLQNVYDEKLEYYEPDMFNAFQEIDYHIAKEDIYKLQAQYILNLNDFNGLDGPDTYQMYQHLCRLKEEFKERYNEDIDRQ